MYNFKYTSIVVAGVGFLLFLLSVIHTSQPNYSHQFLYTHRSPYVGSIKSLGISFGHHPRDSFLKIISEIESNDGRYLEHPLIKKGMHKGYRAIGYYAIMPLTAKNQINISNNPSLFFLKDKSIEEITIILKSSFELQTILARELANKYYKKFNGDSLSMAYAWYAGPHRKTKKLNLLEHFYVKRFIKYCQIIKKCSIIKT